MVPRSTTCALGNYLVVGSVESTVDIACWTPRYEVVRMQCLHAMIEVSLVEAVASVFLRLAEPEYQHCNYEQGVTPAMWHLVSRACVGRQATPMYSTLSGRYAAAEKARVRYTFQTLWEKGLAVVFQQSSKRYRARNV